MPNDYFLDFNEPELINFLRIVLQYRKCFESMIFVNFLDFMIKGNLVTKFGMGVYFIAFNMILKGLNHLLYFL